MIQAMILSTEQFSKHCVSFIYLSLSLISDLCLHVSNPEELINNQTIVFLSHEPYLYFMEKGHGEPDVFNIKQNNSIDYYLPPQCLQSGNLLPRFTSINYVFKQDSSP